MRMSMVMSTPKGFSQYFFPATIQNQYCHMSNIRQQAHSCDTKPRKLSNTLQKKMVILGKGLTQDIIETEAPSDGSSSFVYFCQILDDPEVYRDTAWLMDKVITTRGWQYQLILIANINTSGLVSQESINFSGLSWVPQLPFYFRKAIKLLWLLGPENSLDFWKTSPRPDS